jgi:hypothetical protein
MLKDEASAAFSVVSASQFSVRRVLFHFHRHGRGHPIAAHRRLALGTLLESELLHPIRIEAKLGADLVLHVEENSVKASSPKDGSILRLIVW